MWKKKIIFQTWSVDMHFHNIWFKIYNFIFTVLTITVPVFFLATVIRTFEKVSARKKSGNLFSKLRKNPMSAWANKIPFQLKSFCPPTCAELHAVQSWSRVPDRGHNRPAPGQQPHFQPYQLLPLSTWLLLSSWQHEPRTLPSRHIQWQGIWGGRLSCILHSVQGRPFRKPTGKCSFVNVT